MQELIAGVRSDVAITLYGDDLEMLRDKADEIVKAVAKVPGAAEVKAEQTGGLPYLRVQIRRDKIARYGINARDFLDVYRWLERKGSGAKVTGSEEVAKMESPSIAGTN